MKSMRVLLLATSVFMLILSGCGGSDIPIKDTNDRKNVHPYELDEIKKKVDDMKGVKSFEITYTDGGIYAVLEVTDQKHAKKVAEKAFRLMLVETFGWVDLFVKQDDEMLIQAFKPAGTDKENKWEILY